MTTTSLSLLEGARARDPIAWQRMSALYAPLLQHWLRRYVQPADADDLMQEILLTVAKELPGFDHSNRPGAFRAWMRNILLFRLKNYWRKQQKQPQGRGDSEIQRQLQELEDPESQLSRLWDQQHDQHLLAQLLDAIALRFQPATMEAFRRVVLQGQPPEQVACDLGMSLNAVVIAKCRVLKELRNSTEGLLEP